MLRTKIGDDRDDRSESSEGRARIDAPPTQSRSANAEDPSGRCAMTSSARPADEGPDQSRLRDRPRSSRRSRRRAPGAVARLRSADMDRRSVPAGPSPSRRPQRVAGSSDGSNPRRSGQRSRPPCPAPRDDRYGGDVLRQYPMEARNRQRPTGPLTRGPSVGWHSVVSRGTSVPDRRAPDVGGAVPSAPIADDRLFHVKHPSVGAARPVCDATPMSDARSKRPAMVESTPRESAPSRSLSGPDDRLREPEGRRRQDHDGGEPRQLSRHRR